MQGRTLESLRAVRTFLDEYSDKLPGIKDSSQSKRLDAIVAEIDGHLTAQSGNELASQSATQKHRSLREVLIRDHMTPIAKIAAAELPDSPEVQPLRMPKGRPSIERLRGAALGMAEAAGPFSATFVGAGLGEDFIKQLIAAADAMVAPVGTRKTSRVARGGATNGLKTALSQGRRTVHALDALVKRALKGDSTTLRAWNIAKRVERITPPAPSAKPAGPAVPAPAAPSAQPAIPAPAPTN